MSERARDDVRLAWLIVGTSGTLTLALLTLLLVWVAGHAKPWLPAHASARPVETDGGAMPEATIDSDTPLPVAEGPAPPDTARPIGSAADWVEPNDYPPSALRNGYEGRVRATVSVNAAGQPLGCAVRQSSGHWSLDNATCAAFLNKGRFDAAPRGPAVRHWTSPIVRWVLPHDAS